MNRTGWFSTIFTMLMFIAVMGLLSAMPPKPQPAFAGNVDTAVTTGRISNYQIQHPEDEHTPRDSLPATETLNQMVMGVATVDLGASSDASAWNLNATDQVASARAMVLRATNATQNYTINVPDWAGKVYAVDNNATGTYTCTVSASGTATVTIAAGSAALLYVDPSFNVQRLSADQ
jgi:hypothetical protein